MHFILRMIEMGTEHEAVHIISGTPGFISSLPRDGLPTGGTYLHHTSRLGSNMHRFICRDVSTPPLTFQSGRSVFLSLTPLTRLFTLPLPSPPLFLDPSSLQLPLLALFLLPLTPQLLYPPPLCLDMTPL